MSMTGLPVFDDTLQTTNIWLKDLMERLDTKSRQDAYRALRVTLHALRDRIPNSEAVQFAAQLPILIRGVFYEGWKLNKPTSDEHTVKAFLEKLAPDYKFADVRLSDQDVLHEVFGLLRSKITDGEIDDVKACLPPALKSLWDSAPVMQYYDQILPILD